MWEAKKGLMCFEPKCCASSSFGQLGSTSWSKCPFVSENADFFLVKFLCFSFEEFQKHFWGGTWNLTVQQWQISDLNFLARFLSLTYFWRETVGNCYFLRPVSGSEFLGHYCKPTLHWCLEKQGNFLRGPFKWVEAQAVRIWIAFQNVRTFLDLT